MKITAGHLSLSHFQLTVIELPSIGSLPLFVEVLGRKNFTWITELIEARKHENQYLVLLRWIYRPIDLPAKQRDLKNRKSELILNGHFDIVDERVRIFYFQLVFALWVIAASLLMSLSEHA